MEPIMMTAAEIAESYGVTRQAVHVWIKGGCPRIETQKGALKVYLLDMFAVDEWLRDRGAKVKK